MAYETQLITPYDVRANLEKYGEQILFSDKADINGLIIELHTYDRDLLLEMRTPEGKLRLVRVRKAEGQDLGLDFETYLMDRPRACANRCVFCFIDQNPPGMRRSIYFKDDDARLSFLMGCYITLTNLTRR